MLAVIDSGRYKGRQYFPNSSHILTNIHTVGQKSIRPPVFFFAKKRFCKNFITCSSKIPILMKRTPQYTTKNGTLNNFLVDVLFLNQSNRIKKVFRHPYKQIDFSWMKRLLNQNHMTYCGFLAFWYDLVQIKAKNVLSNRTGPDQTRPNQTFGKFVVTDKQLDSSLAFLATCLHNIKRHNLF